MKKATTTVLLSMMVLVAAWGIHSTSRSTGAADAAEQSAGRFGFAFGGTSKHDKPPLAKDDKEKKALAALEEMTKGRWYLNVTTREGRLLRQLTEAVGAKCVVENRHVERGIQQYGLRWERGPVEGASSPTRLTQRSSKLRKRNFRKAGVDDVITVIEGDAHDTILRQKGPIDIVFLDAEKKGYVDYLKKLLPPCASPAA